MFMRSDFPQPLLSQQNLWIRAGLTEAMDPGRLPVIEVETGLSPVKLPRIVSCPGAA